MTPTLRRFIVSLVAAMMYGGWAFYINHFFGWDVAVRACIVQALISFSVTSLLTWGIDTCFYYSGYFWFASFLPLTLIIIFMAAIHAILGTPRVISTILPSFIIGGIFSLLYTANIRKQILKIMTN